MKGSKDVFRLIFKKFEPVFDLGIVLCDPKRLDDFCHGESQGADLLARFDSMGEWEALCQQGIMACVFDALQSEYTLIVRHSDAEAYLQSPPITVLQRVDFRHKNRPTGIGKFEQPDVLGAI